MFLRTKPLLAVKTAELQNNGNRIINLNPAFRKKFLAAVKIAQTGGRGPTTQASDSLGGLRI
jgi:ABC-type sulfate transport system substrate-binding protein